MQDDRINNVVEATYSRNIDIPNRIRSKKSKNDQQIANIRTITDEVNERTRFIERYFFPIDNVMLVTDICVLMYIRQEE